MSDKKYWDETYYMNLKESEQDFFNDIWMIKYKDIICNINNKNAIDLGCGLGQDSIWLSENGFNVISCDFLEKVLEAGELPNLKLLKIDAEDLTDIFAENEVEGVYLNFSDPWPKPRHAKRRLTHENFLTRYEQITVPNGYLRFKTDNRLLFEYSLVSVTGYGMKLEDVALDLHQREALDWNIMTEYEEKFSAKGQPIYRLEAQFQSKKLA